MTNAQQAGTLLAAFAVALIATVAVRAVAHRRGLVVAPREDRWHLRPTALYGGVAIAVGALVSLLATGGVPLYLDSAAGPILAAAAVLFVVGLVDDARDIGPVGKFILQIMAGTLLVMGGVIYPLSGLMPVDALVTLFWFVGIANAFNLLDNMDGVTAGVAAIAALGFAIFFASAGSPALAAVSLATAGAAGGFLVFNFKPASIFMGDSGSLFLGGILAGLGAAYPMANGGYGPAVLVVPALILMVPVLDTALVMVTRTLHNRRISVGGRDHSTHRLVAMGFSEARAAIFLYGFGAAAVVVAWSVRWLAPGAGLWLGLVFLTGALVFTGYLGRLYRYDDGQPDEERRRGLIVRNILLKRRGLVLLLDVVLFGVAYYGAYVIYYEGSIPADMGAIANSTLPVVVVLKLLAFQYFRVYRGVWNRAGLADVHRIVKAVLLGELVVIGLLFLVDRGAGIPRTVFVLDLLLSGALATAARSSFGSLDRFRQRLRADDGQPVVIYGAGPEADPVLRSLEVREEYGWLRPVAFIDDRENEGTLIHGLPVLGGTKRVGQILDRTGAGVIILAARLPDGKRGRYIREACRERGVDLLTSEFSLRPFDGAETLPTGSRSTGPLETRGALSVE
jgi:UDP-GlcNAc:undecaprenyl-phosphate/decaprenyl-phosphate GlcNAc-1-phosphate transferase